MENNFTVELSRCVLEFYVKPKDFAAFYDKCSRLLLFRDIRSYGNDLFLVTIRFDSTPTSEQIDDIKNRLKVMAGY
jgi:hypothetical protein